MKSKKKVEFSYSNRPLAISPDYQYVIYTIDGQSCCWNGYRQYPVKTSVHNVFSQDCKHLFCIGYSDIMLHNFIENEKYVAYYESDKRDEHYALYHKGIVVGGFNENIYQFEPVDYQINHISAVTAVRLWDFILHEYQEPMAICPACGKYFKPSEKILDVIMNYMETYLKDTLTPYFLQLPADAWSNQVLHCSCPQCAAKLRFSPFIA